MERESENEIYFLQREKEKKRILNKEKKRKERFN